MALAGGSVTGTSTVSYTQGYDIVSGTKRAPRFEGETAYFDFRGATLQTTIRQQGQPGPDRQAEPDRAVCLPRRGRPAEAGPATRPGRSARYRGRCRAPAEYELARPEADADAPLNHVLSTPEWVGGGLAELREQVHRILERPGPPRDPKVAEGVEFFLSETSVMRMISDILGDSGAISPMLRDSEGNDRGHLIVTARLRGIQASTKSKLGVKEEAQRFINVEDNKAQGGAGTVTLTGNVARIFGDPEAELGGFSNIGGGVNVAATLSSERSHVVTTGSGDIRGMVIWGDSILYLSDFEFTVQVVTPDARFGEPPFLVGPDARATGTVNAGMRVPELHQKRFEALLDAG